MTNSDDLRRANQRKHGSGCPECGGYVQLPSGWLPHDPDCTRGQDQERAVLARTGSPFPTRDVDPLDSPWSTEGPGRTYFPARSYWEADVDLAGAPLRILVRTAKRGRQ